MKKCKICQIEKPYEDFNRNNKSFDGYLKKCKSCLKEYRKELQDGIKLTQQERLEIMSIAKEKTLENERELTNNLLRAMGYEPDSLISVHEQFIVRHMINNLINSNS